MMRWPRRAVLPALALQIAACSSRPVPREPQSFLRATPIVEYGPSEELVPPASDGDATTAGRGPGGLSASAPPASSSAGVAAPKDPAIRPPPRAVLAQANSLASRAPEESGFINAVTTYAYEPGGFYKIFTAPWRVTDIALEPGEELLGPVAGGDPVRWRLDIGTGAVDGVPQKHLFLKPMRAGLKTNLTLTTNVRTYLLDLESLEDTFMVSVSWTYPQEEGAGLPGAASPPPSSPRSTERVEVDRLHFDYKIEVINGHPTWKPRAVYDDGVHTYIRFDRKLLTGEAPALYVRERNQLQLVNYRVKETLYVVDRLFRVAELRLGNDDNQDVVRLERSSH